MIASCVIEEGMALVLSAAREARARVPTRGHRIGELVCESASIVARAYRTGYATSGQIQRLEAIVQEIEGLTS